MNNKTIYVTEAQVEKYLPYIVKEYPNPFIKDCVKDGQNIQLNIVSRDAVILITKMTKEKKDWYLCRTVDEDTYMLQSTDYFPTDLIAGVNSKNEYSEDTLLSRQTGYLRSKNTGVSAAIIRASKLAECMKILKANHFSVIIE